MSELEELALKIAIARMATFPISDTLFEGAYKAAEAFLKYKQEREQKEKQKQ